MERPDSWLPSRDSYPDQRLRRPALPIRLWHPSRVATESGTERLLALLDAAPQRIAVAAASAPAASLTMRTGTEPWSVNDVLAHLRACQDVRGKLVNEMLTRDHPEIRYVSPRTYIRKTDYPDRPFHESLAAFAADREAFVQLLRGLARDEWLRSADLKGRRTESVLDCAEYLVAHEAPHLEQIEALVRGGG